MRFFLLAAAALRKNAVALQHCASPPLARALACVHATLAWLCAARALFAAAAARAEKNG
jgi:hypothetical protein